ncbi:MAG: S41 family peptidase [Bryobacteraceae bacterium]|jgi:carboxyl-terminal processing protease
MNSRTKWFVVIGSTCLTIMLLIGSMFGQSADQKNEVYKHLNVFSDVVAHIKNDYVEEPDMKAVTLGALNGMLDAVDPFASYLNADQYHDYLKNKDVKRPDVGLVLSKKFGYLGVLDSIPGSPAAKAGLVTGDMIESIKGITTRDMPLAYARMMLEGDLGEAVDLSVVRVRRPEPATITLNRTNIVLPPVEGKLLDEKTGYINIDALSPALVNDTRTAIQSLQKKGAQQLVIDVRDCGTGSPEDGIALTNLFLDKGQITYLTGQRYPQKVFNADPAKAVTTLPVAVLTNGGTAGAAEFLAAAVQDNKRGQVVGERTHGDAGLLQAITMEDGGAIILTVAKYYTPGGKAIQDTGVVPATLMREPETQVEYDDNGLPIPSPQEELQKKTENDPVVKKALEVLAKG